MDPTRYLPLLLGVAWLVPLASFLIIWVGYSLPQMAGKRVSYRTSALGGYVATGAIVLSVLLSFFALFGVWLPNHPLADATHHGQEHDVGQHAAETESHDAEEHANN
ncbi:MAG: hypothetical protein IH926_13385, partial [Proteobacteria bacterium]|nr:hypothetical protein [Pseudomonadota bacterium]